MYAVELFLDKEADIYVRHIWNELSNENIDSSLNDIKEIRPHITLAVYEDINESDFIEELLNIHSNYQEHFKAFNEKANPYYLPGRWNPHCTLAIGLTTEKLKKVFNFSVDRFKPIRVTLNDIGLVKIEFKDGKCVSSIRID